MTENKTKVSEELSKAGETSVITPLLLKLDTFNQDYIIRHPENPDCPWEWDFRKLFGRVMGGRSVMGYADFEETAMTEAHILRQTYFEKIFSEAEAQRVIKAWATEGHSVALPGLGTKRFGLRAKAVEDVNDVKASLIKTRRIIFTPTQELKDELADTAIQITCYDRNGEEVKRVTSADPGTVEDPEAEQGSDNGGSTNGGNTNGGSTGGNTNGGYNGGSTSGGDGGDDLDKD